MLPGATLLYALTLSFWFSMVFSPVASVALVSLLSMVYGAIGIPAGLLSIVIVPSGLCLLMALGRRQFGRHTWASLETKSQDAHNGQIISARPFSYYRLVRGVSRDCCHAGRLPVDWGIPALYVAIGCLLMCCVFLCNLLDVNMMIPAFDGLFHVNLIKNFSDSANYSSFGSSLYRGLSDVRAPMVYSGFYPSAWHAMTALGLIGDKISVALAVNASLFVIGAFVFPLGLYAMLAFVFNHDKKKLLAGSVVAPMIAVYPWWLSIMQGFQVAQLLSQALVPYAAALLGWLVVPWVCGETTGRLFTVGLFVVPGIIALLALGAVGLSQPNGVFAVGVFGVSFLIEALYAKWLKPGKNRNILKYLAFFVVVGVIWVLLYKFPPLRNVVQFNWQATQMPEDAIGQILSFTFDTAAQPQWTFTVFLAIGLLVMLAYSTQWWPLVATGYFATAYVLSTAAEGSLKHLFGGFWYTDPARLASLCLVAMVPTVVLGFWAICSWMIKGLCTLTQEAPALSIRVGDETLLSKGAEKTTPSNRVAQKGLVAFGCGVVVFVIVAMPTYQSSPDERMETSYGYIEEQIEWLSDPSSETLLNEAKRDFAQEAKQIAGNNLVINSPDDMSAFLYAKDDLNVYYRRNQVPSEEDRQRGDDTETSFSRTLRLKLAEYATNPDVQYAVESTGAKYVLKLEGSHETGHFHTYQAKDWVGIDSITPETPGFKLLISNGEMQFYEIEPLS
ncbi:DUF6541 family protein [Muricaecibacterium torontonense]|uniref:DUF6541 family protein n=1 Tax=Muricaecibacterium torontonense TaxID=3032871 RepID=UPI0030842321